MRSIGRGLGALGVACSVALGRSLLLHDSLTNLGKLRVVGTLSLILAAMAAVAVLLGVSLRPTHNVSAHAGHTSGLEFSLAVGGCNTAGDAKGNCVVTMGSTFNAAVSLDDISGIGNVNYDALAYTMEYSGVTSKNNPDVTWPDCAIEASATPAGFVNASCSIGIGAAHSTYTGVIGDSDFNCTADGTLSLKHSPADTLVIDSKGANHTEAGLDALNIDCQPVPPADTATPTWTPTLSPLATPSATSAATSTAVGSPMPSATSTATVPTGTPPLATPPTATPATGTPPTATPTGAAPTGTPPTATPTGTPALGGTPTFTNTPTFTRTPTRTSTPTPPMLNGDANCDRRVNPLDALAVLQLSAGLIGGLPCSGAADVNHDGRIGPIDAALILQYDAGIIDALPA